MFGRFATALGAVAVAVLGPSAVAVLAPSAVLGPAAVTVLGPPAGTVLESSAAAAEATDLRVEMRQPQLTLQAGGPPTALVFSVVNDGPAQALAAVATVRLPLGDRGARVTATQPVCSPADGPLVLSCPLPALAPGSSVQVTVTVAPPPAGSVAAGEKVTDSGSASVRNPDGDPNPGNDASPFAVRLGAEPAPDGITQVAGQVEDGTGAQPVPNATVVVTDSAGNTGRTATDEGGRFVYNAAKDAPLVPGRLTVTAFKDGFQESSTTLDASDGGIVQDVRLAVTPIPRTGGAPTPTATDQAGTDDSGPGSTLTVILGSLAALVALAAVAYWFYRHRDTESPLTSGRPDQGSHPTIRMNLDGLVSGLDDGHPPAATGLGSDATVVLGKVYDDGPDDTTRVHDRPVPPPRYRAPEDDTRPLPTSQPDGSGRGRRSGKGRHSAAGRRRGR